MWVAKLGSKQSLQSALCNLAFRESKSRLICVEVLGEVLARGYVRVPRGGLKRYVVKRLTDIGVLVEKQVPRCIGGATVKIAVLNLAFLHQLYQLLQKPTLPPVCLE